MDPYVVEFSILNLQEVVTSSDNFIITVKIVKW